MTTRIDALAAKLPGILGERLASLNVALGEATAVIPVV